MDGVKTPSLRAEKGLDLLRRRIMKWLLGKEFIVPFVFTFLLADFINNRWILLVVVVFLMSILWLVEWLLKRKNKSFHFPTKDFLILSVFSFLIGHFIDSLWFYLAVVIPFVCVFFVVKSLLKRKTESEPEKV